MTDPGFYLTMASASLVGLGMVVLAALAGWRGWLALKQQQLTLNHAPPPLGGPTAGGRIEIADLKERIRKLEAIAAGVEL